MESGAGVRPAPKAREVDRGRPGQAGYLGKTTLIWPEFQGFVARKVYGGEPPQSRAEPGFRTPERRELLLYSTRDFQYRQT